MTRHIRSLTYPLVAIYLGSSSVPFPLMTVYCWAHPTLWLHVAQSTMGSSDHMGL